MPFRKGDYNTNPIDNGQWGARFVFSTPQQIQLGFHYFYNRFNFDDSSQATGFFGRGGRIVPLGFVGIDWANRYAGIAGWSTDYFVTPQLIASVFQNYYFVPGFGGEVAQPWPLGGLLRERDETGLRLTWQF